MNVEDLMTDERRQTELQDRMDRRPHVTIRIGTVCATVVLLAIIWAMVVSCNAGHVRDTGLAKACIASGGVWIAAGKQCIPPPTHGSP